MIETNENAELAPYYRIAEAQYTAETAIKDQDAQAVKELLESPISLHINWDALAQIPTTAEIVRLVAYYSPAKLTWASLFEASADTRPLVDLAFKHSHFQPIIDLPVSTQLVEKALAYYDQMTFIYKEHLIKHALPQLIALDADGSNKSCGISPSFLQTVLRHEGKYDDELLEFLENELFPTAAMTIDTVSAFRARFFGQQSTISDLTKKLWYAREFTLKEVKDHIVELYNPKLTWDASGQIAILAKLTRLTLTRLKELKLIAIKK